MRLPVNATVYALLIAAVLLTASLPAQTITTLAGSGAYGYAGDSGPATSARLNMAGGVAVDAQGNTYIADTWNHRVRKIAGGIVTTLAGTGQEGSAGNGGPAAQATLSFPRAVAVDAQGNVYVSDTGNSAVRKITPNGTISAFAGTGAVGFAGDLGAATSARLSYPRGLAVDSNGNVYVADTWNYRIRKISAAGTIQTVAGNGSYGVFGDGGQAVNASLGAIEALALDAQGNLYISDPYHHRVRRIGTGGVITTVVGGSFGDYGDGGAAAIAKLKYPRGVAVDQQGNLLLADSMNHRIRKALVSGSISTVAGTGSAGYSGDGGLATGAQLNTPGGLAIDSAGSLVLADLLNYRVRRVQAQGGACGCDVNGDGASNIADAQSIINQASGAAPAGCDLNGDGAVNIADVQRVINAVLGLGCQ
jgi:sugar lactone lactonase YvrE